MSCQSAPASIILRKSTFSLLTLYPCNMDISNAILYFTT
ncbi:unnamed protein product, partial [Staurois parvus]